MSTETITTPEIDLEQRKRELAYQFWEEEGRPEGRSDAHWERACLVLMSLDEDTTQPPGWLKRIPAEAKPEAQVTPAAPVADTVEDAAITALRRKIVARGAA